MFVRKFKSTYHSNNDQVYLGEIYQKGLVVWGWIAYIIRPITVTIPILLLNRKKSLYSNIDNLMSASGVVFTSELYYSKISRML